MMNQNVVQAMGTPRRIKAGFGTPPLSDDEIFRVAPSAFAASKHESRSERYAYIPTVNVIQAMRREGFFPVAACQGKSRIEGKAEFTKHMIRFRRDDGVVRKVGDAIPEIVLRNSHDGTSTYALDAGCFRIACLNGLVVAIGDATSVKVPHKGDVVDRVIEGSYTVIDAAKVAVERATEWQAITMQPAEQVAFARAAAALRFDAEEQRVNPADLVRVRRAEDQNGDLWTVFNRTQEALIRGGQRYRTENGRRVVTREVKAIDKNVGLNQALWTLGEEMARLKRAA